MPRARRLSSRLLSGLIVTIRQVDLVSLGVAFAVLMVVGVVAPLNTLGSRDNDD